MNGLTRKVAKNLLISHHLSCNKRKSSKSEDEFLEYIKPLKDGFVDSKSLAEYWQWVKKYNKFIKIKKHYENI